MGKFLTPQGNISIESFMEAIIILISRRRDGANDRRIDWRAIRCRDINAIMPVVWIKIRIGRMTISLRKLARPS